MCKKGEIEFSASTSTLLLRSIISLREDIAEKISVSPIHLYLQLSTYTTQSRILSHKRGDECTTKL